MATLTTNRKPYSGASTAANNTKLNTGAPTLSTQKLLWAAPLTGIIAAAVNSLIFLTYGAVGLNIILPLANPADPTQGTPIILPVVALLSFVPALGAGALVWALNKFTARPISLFIVISTVALILSFGMSLFMDMPAISKIALDVMHVVAGVIIVGGLINLTRES